MASFFTIPDTNQIVYEGDIVQLNEYPDVNFIASYDWYTYHHQQYKGWFFVSVTNSSIVSANDVNLGLITVVSSSHQSSVVPILPPFPPGPPRPPYPDIYKAILSRTMITVETIAQRNSLDDAMLINGRVCRVNHNNTGALAYYQWNGTTLKWDDLKISDNVLQNTSLAHDVTIENNTTLKIPVYGHEDISVDLSQFGNPKSAEYNPANDTITLTYGRYGLPDQVFVMDVSPLRDIYSGVKSGSVDVSVDYSDRTVKAEVIIDPANNNALIVTTEGLYVNIDGKVDKLTSYNVGNLLVTSAGGGMSDSGYSIRQGSTMGNASNVLPTEAQIRGVISESESDTDAKIESAKQEAIATADEHADTKIANALNLQTITTREGHVVVSTNNTIKATEYSLGGAVLDDNPNDKTLATESAVRKAFSWGTI